MSASYSQRSITRAPLILSLLALATALAWWFASDVAGDAASPSQGASAVRFALPFIGQVEYGRELVWPVNRVVSLMLFLACCLAYRHADMAPRALLAGAGCFGAMAAVLIIAGAMMWHLLPGHSRFLCAAIVTLLYFSLQREMIAAFGTPAAVLGTMLALLAGLLALSVVRPDDSYLLAWPLPVALAAYGASHLLADAPHLRVALALAGALPAALLLGPRLLHSPMHSAAHGASFMLTLVVMLGCAGTISSSLGQQQRCAF